ncbi:MAG: XTP/dITP diphosphatase [bacterium]
MTKLILATKNAHKVKEILKIWGEMPFEVLTLESFPHLPAVVEDGKTFAENALKKAREICRETNLLTVSDDSGIEADALNGAPGIYSARYAGEGASDSENNEKLVKALAHLPADSPLRTGRFRCVAALVAPGGFEAVVEGVVEGRILESLHGKNGFGYDPLFFIPELGKTTADMSLEEKNTLSHRSQAFRKMKEILLSRRF